MSEAAAGDVVLDPFARPAWGPPQIACQRQGRKARLIEVDPQSADVICQRWQQYAGNAAVRESNRLSFERIARERRKAA